MSSTGIIMNFGRLQAILWNMVSSSSPQLHTRKLLQSVFEDLAITANRIKPLVARSTNGIVIYIYLWSFKSASWPEKPRGVQ